MEKRIKRKKKLNKKGVGEKRRLKMEKRR